MKIILLLSSLLFGFTMHCSDGDQKTITAQLTAAAKFKAAMEVYGAARQEFRNWQAKLEDAIAKDDRQTIDTCVEQGIVSTNSFDNPDFGPTLCYPLHHPTQSISLLKYMLTKTVAGLDGTVKPAFDLEEMDPNGYTPLFFSIHTKNQEATELLLNHGSKITNTITTQCSNIFHPRGAPLDPFTTWFQKYIADHPDTSRDDIFKKAQARLKDRHLDLTREEFQKRLDEWDKMHQQQLKSS